MLREVRDQGTQSTPLGGVIGGVGHGFSLGIVKIPHRGAHLAFRLARLGLLAQRNVPPDGASQQAKARSATPATGGRHSFIGLRG